jgi:hypothetical protein
MFPAISTNALPSDAPDRRLAVGAVRAAPVLGHLVVRVGVLDEIVLYELQRVMSGDRGVDDPGEVDHIDRSVRAEFEAFAARCERWDLVAAERGG